MKNKRKEPKWNIRRDSRGLTMVEMICAVAIFAVLAAIIGTVVVVSARTYNRGITETTLQQEAQLAANRISTIVQDACEVKFDEATGTLTLVTNEPDPVTGDTYIIRHEGEQLLYSDGAISDVPLAEKIAVFSVHNQGGHFNEDDFKDTRTLYLDMQVLNGSKMYNVSYAISARNEMTIDIPDSGDPIPVAPRFICDEDVIVMVPGESYNVELGVRGMGGMEVTASFPDGELSAIDTSRIASEQKVGITIKVPVGLDKDVKMLKLQVDAKDEMGSIKATRDIVVYVRRVTDIKLTYNTASQAMDDDVGEKYTFYANVVANNPTKWVNLPSDAGYQRPWQVKWDTKLEYVASDGNKHPIAGTTQTEGSKTTITYGEYLKIEYEDTPDETVPKAYCTQLKDWADGMELTMTAISWHADGRNKANSDYDDVSDTVTIRLRSNLEITMEPNEVVELEMNSSREISAGNISFVYNGASDLKSDTNPQGTTAEYDDSAKKIRIKLGNDEKGEGKTYTFTIDVLIRNVKKSQITVHVRRLDQIWVQIIQDPKVAKTYDFRARLNVERNQPNNQETTKYLYDAMYDPSLNQAAQKKIVSQTLASRITWEYFNYSVSRTVPVHTDSVICMGGVGDKGVIIGDYNLSYDEYEVVHTGKNANIKPARIEQDADGKWFIKQYPEIDLSIKKGGSLPANTELRVTIEMLHPQGTINGTAVNKAAVKYHECVIDNAHPEREKGEWVVFARASLTGNNDRIVASGFQRADEYSFVSNIADMRSGFGDQAYDSEQRSFFRYSVHGKEEWTPYYLLTDESPRAANFVGTTESLVFRPETAYDLDIINVVYSKSKKLIYWPLDESLLADGTGWKEEGFRLWNGDEIMKNNPQYSGDYKNQMIAKEKELYNTIRNSAEQWLWKFEVPRVEMRLSVGDAREWKVQDASTTLDTMTSTTPLHLQGGANDSWTPGDQIAVQLTPTSFCLTKRQFHMDAIIDQKINGQWVERTVPLSNANDGWWLQAQCPQFQVYNVYGNATGEVRIRTIIKNMEWKNINGRLFNRSYESYYTDTALYDVTTDEGILYIKFN